MLTEIVRQAKDSPIIQLSQMILQGISLRPGKIGESVFITDRRIIPDDVLLRADQVLCGTNATRYETNNRMRHLLGYKDRFPEVGDKLLCVKNNWSAIVEDIPIINGTLGKCVGMRMTPEKYFMLKFVPDYSKENIVLRVDKSFFLGKKVKFEDDFLDEFEFGYVITVHKAQGSEFNNVVLLRDFMPKQVMRRWMYTAVTRAKKSLVIGL